MSEQRQAQALLDTVGVHLLEAQRLIAVTGDDAVAWLQGQITQDVRALAPGHGALSLLLDKTGKVRSDAFVLRREEALLLVVPGDKAEALLALLDAHLIMEDVSLSLAPERVITVQGPLAMELPRADLEAFVCDRLDRGPGLDLVVPAEQLEARLEELGAWAEARGGARVDAAGFERARILAGIPRLDVDFGAHTLPQEAGLARRAVCFTKGCYLGQEAVVMLEHRGKPPKRLAVVRGPEPLAVGAALRTAEGAAAGTLTSLAPAEGGYLGLALLKRAHAQAGLRLEAEGPLEVVRLVE